MKRLISSFILISLLAGLASCGSESDRSDYQSLRRTMFFEGRALMIDGNLNEVSYMRDMRDDFGIVPWPKFDSSCNVYFQGGSELHTQKRRALIRRSPLFCCQLKICCC